MGSNFWKTAANLLDYFPLALQGLLSASISAGQRAALGIERPGYRADCPIEPLQGDTND